VEEPIGGDLTRRAAVHAALGDPHRLAIVEDLLATDRSPGDLGQRLGMATNLVAHHLDVLAEAGLVDRVPSSGDRRRRYVRLRAGALDGLALAPPRPTARPVFVCTANSARSQLAAALWTARTGRPAASAGTHPAERVHPEAVAAARRIGLDLSSARPRSLGRRSPSRLLVTVCDRANEELGTRAGDWHWSIPDPVPIGTAAAFDATVDRLEERIRALAGR